MTAEVQRAEHLFTIKRYREALEYCRAALAAEPEDELALYLGGFSALMLDDGETAAEMARALLHAHPDSPYGHEILGHLAVEAGNQQAAEGHFRAALRAWPDRSYYLALLGNFLGTHGRLEEGITVARKGLERDPEDSYVLQVLQRLYRLNEEPELAEEFAARTLAVDAEKPGAHLEAGLLMLEKGHREAARGRFLESLRLDPASGDTKEIMAHERVRTHPFFRHGVFLRTESGFVIAALLTPLFWLGLSLLWTPLVYIAYAAFGLVILGYGYVGLFRLCVRLTLRRIRMGDA